MECKFILQVFRFNHKTDYLPYYKKHVIKIDTKKTVADLLCIIQEDEKSFGYPKEINAAIKINGKALFTNEKLEDIREFFGKELKLEPLSTKRVTHDLIINEEDFDSRFDVLDAFVDAEDRKVFKSYLREHCVSPIITIEEDFLGDGLFAFAYDMVQKYPERKEKILNTLCSKDLGIWLHVNISNKLYPPNTELESKIDFLKNEILKQNTPANSYVGALQNTTNSF